MHLRRGGLREGVYAMGRAAGDGHHLPHKLPTGPGGILVAVSRIIPRLARVSLGLAIALMICWSLSFRWCGQVAYVNRETYGQWSVDLDEGSLIVWHDVVGADCPVGARMYFGAAE